MIYYWYQADFKPVEGQQYNRARFRESGPEAAALWVSKNEKFKTRHMLRLTKLPERLQLDLNQQLIKHLQKKP